MKSKKFLLLSVFLNLFAIHPVQAILGNSSSGGVKTYAFQCESKPVFPGANSAVLNLFDISEQSDGSLYLAEVTIVENGTELTSYTEVKRLTESEFSSDPTGLLKIDVQNLQQDGSADSVLLEGKHVPFSGVGSGRLINCDQSDIRE